MDIRIHGIIQYLDGGHKRTQVIVSKADPTFKETIQLADDMLVNNSAIQADLRKRFNSPLDKIVIPHHIRAKNIKGV